MLQRLAHKKAAANYAIAFLKTFDLTREELCEGLDTIDSLHEQHALFFKVLEYSSVATSLKQVALTRLLEKHSLHDAFAQYLRMLITRKALYLLPYITKALRSEFKKRHNIVDVTVSSADPLSSDLQRALEARVSGLLPGTLRFSYQEDPSLIAGIKILTTTHCWEESIARRIREIERQLTL